VSGAAPEFFYDGIAERFEGLDHPADVRRRLRIVFDECLADRSLAGKRTLDAGCGYGPFSAWAAARGAEVVSLDIGHRLVACTMARAGSRGVVADACQLAVRDESFDVIVSSEMIEHTREPMRAVAELARILRDNGVLVLTTPNRVWQAAVRGASMLRLRPFRGLENFVAWGELERACSAAGLDVLGHRGFHPWPFQLGCAGAARTVERYLSRGSLGKLMVNQALIAQKRRRTASASPGI
jgi:2-polyprenyl-6-hydroxyphenyl methylase/3-demethylubiquinone-9 3-methyltransferase